MKILLTSIILWSAFLAGCTTTSYSSPLASEIEQNGHQSLKANQQGCCTVQPVKKEKVQAEARPKLIKITGIGYGSESTFESYTPGQRRLMAIRASKLDAYRSLAEQLNGIKIDSNTSIATLTTQSDSFRARINAVVRGARLVSITPMADHNYETVLEVYVDRSFFNNVFVYTAKRSNLLDRAVTPEELCANGACQ